MHGDAVVGLLGQLVQSHHRALVDGAVFGLEVVHKGGHSPSVAKGRPVAAPHAAAADGLGQVAEESVVGLLGAENKTQEIHNAVGANKYLIHKHN